MKAPWSVVENDSRVSLLDAAGQVMTEIIPGQVNGVLVTKARMREIAEFIVGAINECDYRGLIQK